MKIKFLTVGGTIDKIYFDQKSEYQVGDPLVDKVLQRANVVIEYEVESILRKDSLEMTNEDRVLIRKAVESSQIDRLVITHGTDTMVDTAIALSGVVDKTVILTGSMYPAEFRDSDAIFNIGCAVTAAQTLPSGIYIVMNGRVFDPANVRKNVAMNRFEQIEIER